MRGAKKFCFGFGYGLAVGWAGFQAYELYLKIGCTLYSGLVYYVVVALLCGLSSFALFARATWADSFIKRWNWIFLVSSLLAVWLGPSPETRIPNLYLLGFATLACALY